jgi:hypothetical protein
MNSKLPRILGIGIDESNHGGTRKEEIVVAAFSMNHQDTIAKDFPNRRNQEILTSWMTKPGTDYRVTTIPHEKGRFKTNLQKVTPFLVRAYLEDKLLEVDSLEIYLDGSLNRNARKAIKNTIPRYTEDQIKVEAFTKRRDGRKRPHCPTLVYIADMIAHNLLDKPFKNLVSDRRYVALPF